jgi:carotenoid cleavage dioxygenase
MRRVADSDAEFPQVHPALVGQQTRWLVMAAASSVPRTDGRAPLLEAVQLLDTPSGRVRQWDHGPHCIAEEHVCVPKPGRSGELDTWLLGTCFDARRQATVLNLLDTARLEDGPVAQAVLPCALPLGFHGHFSPG